jgi:multidrug resistance protein MdtO
VSGPPATATLPLVDTGELRGGLAALIRELLPRPGRLGDTSRLVALVIVSVAISEVFRIPDPAISAYVIMFVSRSERVSTIKTALVAGAAVILAVFITVVVFMASLSEPALRVPLIALATFIAMFCSRISPLGPPVFAAGFIIAYGLTIGDAIMGVALQSTDVSNTTAAGAPDLLFMPPEEALLHASLWLAIVVALPVALVVAGNLLTGRRPEQLLRTALGARLGACARFCAGEPGGEDALAASAREGTAALVSVVEMLDAHPEPTRRGPDYGSLVQAGQQLTLALLAWPLIATADERQHALQPCVESLRAAERCAREGVTWDLPDHVMPQAAAPAAQSLAVEVGRAWTGIAHALSPRPFATPAAPAAKAAGRLISAAAVRNPETIQFALKVTLAVMLSYAAENLLDWPEIHTCVVTCFFVALGTVGESIHKATLRVCGALIGGALGILTILLLMPIMTDLGHLLLVLAAVTAAAGWVATGSERISYAGWQIGLAYYLTVLQGYGPTLDMQTARDRVIGIILGNLIVLVIFTTFWPVGANALARPQIVLAISKIAALLRLAQRDSQDVVRARSALQTEFSAATNSARTLMAKSEYEPARFQRNARRPIDSRAIAALEVVMLVVSVILNLQGDPAWDAAPAAERQAVLAYHNAMADWFDRCAAWVHSGVGGSTLEAAIPEPLAPDAVPGLAAYTAWSRVLDTDLRAIMRQVTWASPLGAGGVVDHG